MFQLLGLTKKNIPEKNSPEMFIKTMSLFRVGQVPPGVEIVSVFFFFLLYIYILVSFPPALVDVILPGRWQARIIHSLGPGESHG